MGTKKAKKGSVSLQELLHTRRFKYRYRHKEYYLTLPRIGTLSPTAEDNLRRIIESDVLKGTHDNTQNRYKQLLKQVEVVPKVSISSLSLADQLEQFLLKAGSSFSKDLYFYTHRMVINWGHPASRNGTEFGEFTRFIYIYCEIRPKQRDS